LKHERIENMLNLIDFFEYKTQTTEMEKDFNHRLSFLYGPLVEIMDNHSERYLVEWYERFGEDWALVKTVHEFDPFTWWSHNRTFRTEWRIKIWGWRDKPVLLVDHTYNEQDKKVYLHFESNRFDVQLNWLMKAKQFASDTGANLIIETKFKHRLQSVLPIGASITLIDRFEDKLKRDNFMEAIGVYAMYFIGRKEIQSKAYNYWESDGIFENHGLHYKSYDHPVDWVSIPDEKLFESILGL